MKIHLITAQKPDGTFVCLYLGDSADKALDTYDALRQSRGVDADGETKYVAAAMFQRPPTRRRAKFPENALAAGESKDAPAAKAPAGKKKDAKPAKATGEKTDAGDEEDEI